MSKITLTLICLLVFTSPSLARDYLRIIDATVIKVSDGDTIQAQDDLGTKIKVRLYGIDAPETEKMNRKTGVVSMPGQPYGTEAYKALEGKVLDKRVRLEVMATDKYKRLVSVVKIGDRNINREMVAKGFAWAYRKYLDRPHASEYIDAENEARSETRGLWQLSNPQPPWEFRKSINGERNGRTD